jgi:Flp pilus assembly protein TadB
VLRTKTAEARSQFLILALMPPALVMLLQVALPSHAGLLFESTMGLVICLVSTLLWMGSVISARKILAVEL